MYLNIDQGWGVLCLVAASAASPEVTQQAITHVLQQLMPAGNTLPMVGGTGYASTLLFLHGRT